VCLHLKFTTYSNTGCTGPFYKTSGWGHTTVCTKLAISKRALFDLLDADDDGTIRNTGSHSDEAVLGVRLGYMRWYNCGVGSCHSTIIQDATRSVMPFLRQAVTILMKAYGVT